MDTSLINLIAGQYWNVVELQVEELATTIKLHTIVVQPGFRCMGIGSEIMTRLCAYADEVNKILILTPTTGLGATSMERLVDFYRQFDFWDSRSPATGMVAMVRRPRKPADQGNGLYVEPDSTV